MTQNLTKYQVHGLDPWFVEDPPSHIPFPFEEWIDSNEIRIFAKTYQSCFIIISVLYFIFVHVGPKLMKTREPFNLQRSLAVWNFLLAVFSIMGVIRSAPELFGILSQPNGLYKSTCVREGLNQPFVFWTAAFIFSKVFELVDTAFIILRKKKLIFLHWFHHLSMVYATAFLGMEAEPISRFAVVLNYSVHSIMYTYYAIMALQIKLPKKISMMVTSLQILQFISGLCLHVYTLWILANGGECARTEASKNIYITLGVTYLSLFLKLFYSAYIAKPKVKVL